MQKQSFSGIIGNDILLVKKKTNFNMEVKGRYIAIFGILAFVALQAWLVKQNDIYSQKQVCPPVNSEAIQYKAELDRLSAELIKARG